MYNEKSITDAKMKARRAFAGKHAGQCIDWICARNEGALIHPGEILRECPIEYDNMYKVIDICRKEGIVRQVLRHYCSACGKSTGPVYERGLDVPIVFTCPECGRRERESIYNIGTFYRKEKREDE